MLHDYTAENLLRWSAQCSMRFWDKSHAGESVSTLSASPFPVAAACKGIASAAKLADRLHSLNECTHTQPFSRHAAASSCIVSRTPLCSQACSTEVALTALALGFKDSAEVSSTFNFRVEATASCNLVDL